MEVTRAQQSEAEARLRAMCAAADRQTRVDSHELHERQQLRAGADQETRLPASRHHHLRSRFSSESREVPLKGSLDAEGRIARLNRAAKPEGCTSEQSKRGKCTEQSHAPDIVNT